LLISVGESATVESMTMKAGPVPSGEPVSVFSMIRP
jgi:hypothetical protein